MLDIGHPFADLCKIVEKYHENVDDHNEPVEKKDESVEVLCESINEQMQLPRYTQQSSNIQKRESTSAETDYLICYTTMLGWYIKI